jgi:hypothetical protein
MLKSRFCIFGIATDFQKLINSKELLVLVDAGRLLFQI